MPEGPEVRTIGDILVQAIGKTYRSAQIVEHSHFKHKYVRDGIPNLDKLANGFEIDDVNVHGKLIVINVNTDTEDWVILNTLGMSGTWMFNARQKYHARFSFVDDTSVPDHLESDLTFVDQRSYGTIKIVTPDEAKKRIAKIGHDLLQSPMDSAKWEALREKIGHKEIGAALMEQKHFAGIGNIYKAETLYTTGIHPQILIEDLSKDQWAAVNVAAHTIMKNSYESGGSTVKSYAANGKKGKFQRKLMVYKKKKCPEGHPVTNITQKKRTTWFCGVCQCQRTTTDVTTVSTSSKSDSPSKPTLSPNVPNAGKIPSADLSVEGAESFLKALDSTRLITSDRQRWTYEAERILGIDPRT